MFLSRPRIKSGKTSLWTSASITLKLIAETREVFTRNINNRKQLALKRFRPAKRNIRSEFVITEIAWVLYFYRQIWKNWISMDFDKPTVWSEVFEITLIYVARLIFGERFNSVEMLKQQIFPWYRIILEQTISSDGGWNFFRLTIT